MEHINELIIASAYKMSALEELYYLLKNDVFAFAYSIIRDFQLSEDCLQETFLRLPKAAGNFKADKNGKTYILAITKNVAKEIIRSEKKQIKLRKDEANSIYHYSKSVYEIEDLLKPLNKKQVQIINLYIYSQLTFKEIAELLHLPESTVKSRYQRAIKKCRIQEKERWQMKKIEEEYRVKMDSLNMNTDVINNIKSSAYRNVTKANKVVSRPLRTIMVTLVSAILVGCFLFMISLNLNQHPAPNSSGSIPGNTDLQGGSEDSSTNNSENVSSETKLNDSEIKKIIADISKKCSTYAKLKNGRVSVDETDMSTVIGLGNDYNYYKVTEDFKSTNDIKSFLNSFETAEQAAVDSKYFFEEYKNSDVFRPPLYFDIDGLLYRYADYPFKGEGELIWDKAETQINDGKNLTLVIPFSVMGDTSEFKSITLTKVNGKWLVSDGFKG